MTTETGAPATDSPAAPAYVNDGSEISLEEARAMIDAMPDPDILVSEEGEEPPKRAAKAAPVAKEQPTEEREAPVEQESSQEDSDPETDPADKQTQDSDTEDENLPPIERPRSWAKELDEEWNSYPRAAQERIAKRETERDAALRRSQNEAAEVRKAIEAERQQLEQVRKEYENRLPSLEQALLEIQFNEFPDIKTMADVDRMAKEDPFRKIQWDTHQQKLQALAFEKQQATERQTRERQAKRAEYEAEQNKKLFEFVPEMTDAKKASELRERAVKLLTDDFELSRDQLSRWMQDDVGHEILSNASIQRLIVDGLKLRDIQNAPKAVAAKPLPPVQKPGVPRGNANDANIQALERKLAASGNESDGWALLQAKMAQSGRRKAS